MVVSTAASGHWTNYLLPKVEPPGIEGILALFEVAMGRTNTGRITRRR